MSEAATPALEIGDLSHAFGKVQALSGVGLTVERGAFTALLGVNGAGKSTLVNLVTRLYDSRSGEIRVCGADLRRRPAAALRDLGVVFQSRSLDMALTVRQNFLYQGALYGLSPRETAARAETLLEKMRLADCMDRKVRELSGGQQRRVEIARALTHRPKLLLCDEATAGLDIRSRREIVELAHEMAAGEGAGVLWATHLTDEVRGGDSVVILHKGRVLSAGGADEIARGGSLADAFIALTRDPAAEASEAEA